MRVTYNGPIDRVGVTLPDGSEIEAAVGDTIDVPPEVGMSLIRQSIWQKAPASRRAAPEATKADEEDD